MFAGNIGVFTGFKDKGFSVSINTRYLSRSSVSLLKNVALLFMGFKQNSWILRDALV